MRIQPCNCPTCFVCNDKYNMRIYNNIIHVYNFMIDCRCVDRYHTYMYSYLGEHEVVKIDSNSGPFSCNDHGF